MSELSIDLIYSALTENHPWAKQLRFYNTIDSTNTRAKELAAQGAPHGTVLIADNQTGGRGRLGRSFLSPAGKGVYMSVILRPQASPAQLMHLTCAAAVAMCDAVEFQTGIRPGIKWTNDLVLNGRKLAGILTELSLDPRGGCAYAVVGIGINCCQADADFPPELQTTASSLEAQTGKSVDRSSLAAAMIRALKDMDEGLLTKKKSIMDDYRHSCITLGSEVSIHRGDSISHAKAVDIDENGGLVVLYADGRTETVSSGEVSIRGMYGYV